MPATFDPFRLDQCFEPEPVGGSLTSVHLVDDDDPPPVRRPYWLRLMVWILMGVLALSSILNQVGITADPSPTEIE